MLIVGDGHIGDITADFRRNRKTPGRDKGVVSRFVVTNIEPVNQAADQDDQQHAGAGGGEHPMLAQPIAQ
jgi:hypothetical protein